MRQLINSILLTLLMSMVGVKAFAYDLAVKNSDGVTIYYNYINDGKELEVAQSKNYSGNIVIPEEVTYMNRTRKVTSIDEGAFNECRNLTSVTIGNNVTTIGSSAFWNCYDLKSVTISPSVKTIKGGAFGCDNPTSWLRDAFNKVIVNDIAAWCQINFGNGDSNPLTIANHLYLDENEITDLVIPDGVTSIGNYAFSGCSRLASITIPNSVTSIGSSAFSGCSRLASVTISHRVTSIGDYTFYGCSSLTSITIPSSVTSIGYQSFYGCTSLISINIPNSVTSIGSYAFWKCSGLTSVSIGDGVKSIGERAFIYCSSLNSLSIGKSVITIGDCAFKDSNIFTIVSRIENPFIINGIFNINTLNNATLYVPIGTINRYKNTEGWKDFLFIEEGIGDNNSDPVIPKCSLPSINLIDGKLSFSCETEDVDYHWSISTPNNGYGKGESVPFTQTIVVNVYASKFGFLDSEVNTQEFSASGLSGDVNGDGEVNVADHVKLTEIIMNKKQQ